MSLACSLYSGGGGCGAGRRSICDSQRTAPGHTPVGARWRRSDHTHMLEHSVVHPFPLPACCFSLFFTLFDMLKKWRILRRPGSPRDRSSGDPLFFPHSNSTNNNNQDARTLCHQDARTPQQLLCVQWISIKRADHELEVIICYRQCAAAQSRMRELERANAFSCAPVTV